MTEQTTTTVTKPSDTQFAMSRVFDAPRELVYQAYTEPAAISKWWGLRSTTTTVDTMDVRPGGTWRYIQRGEGGEEYAFKGEYREVVPNERLVNTFEFEPMPGHVVVDSAVFEDVDGKTRLTVTSTFDTQEERDGMLQTGMEDGANESWDRLAEYLAASGS
jgi:uncharacterized protein YndB with AHSA1/START domain